MYDWGFNVANNSFNNSLTLSFWFVVIGVTYPFTFSVCLRNNGTTRSFVHNFTVTSSQFQYFTVTIPPDPTGPWFNINSGTNWAGATLDFVFQVGTTYQTATPDTWVAGNFVGTASNSTTFKTTTNATLYLMLPKLELGTVATPFVAESQSVTLAKCQRYYEKSYAPGMALGNNYGVNANGQGMFFGGAASNSITGTAGYKVTKRATPTLTAYAYTGAAGNVSVFTGSWAAWSTILTVANTMNSHQLIAQGSSSTIYLAWDYVADARL
jgi:hypothetical protein